MIGLAMMLAAADGPPRLGYAYMTGEMLYQACHDTGTDRAICLEYIAGVSDAVSNLENTDNMLRAVCKPPEVTKDQLADTVLAYFERHPDYRRVLAAGAVIGALIEKYPCPKEETQRGLKK